MKRFTITFLLFAYLVGGLYALATGGLAQELKVKYQDFPDLDSTGGIADKVVAIFEFAVTVVIMLFQVMGFFVKVLLLSFKPLSWDLGFSVFNVLFKSVWAILLAVAYLDLIQDVYKAMVDLIGAVGGALGNAAGSLLGLLGFI